MMTDDVKKDGDAVASQIVGDKLDGYLVGEGEERKGESPVQRHARKTAVVHEPSVLEDLVDGEDRSARAHRSVRRYQEAVKTPSVFSRARADETLLELRRSAELRAGAALYGPEEWERVVGVVTGYLLDVVEGAGFIVRDGAQIMEARRVVGELMKEMRYLPEEGGGYREVNVKEGK